MSSLSPSNVTVDEITQLESARDAFPTGSLRDALEEMISNLRRGEQILVLQSTDTVTPSEAARVLGMSRAHLYKILDSGALASHIVGMRDRRVVAGDLARYREQLLNAQRRTAVVFAGVQSSDDAMLDEMS